MKKIEKKMESFKRIASDVKLGKNVQIYGFVNLYGCETEVDHA
jgi:hypothetical protein